MIETKNVTLTLSAENIFKITSVLGRELDMVYFEIVLILNALDIDPFLLGNTYDVPFRVRNVIAILDVLSKQNTNNYDALYADFKSIVEAKIAVLGTVTGEEPTEDEEIGSALQIKITELETLNDFTASQDIANGMQMLNISLDDGA